MLHYYTHSVPIKQDQARPTPPKNADVLRATTSTVVELLGQHVSEVTACRILDLACGTGNPAVELATRYPNSSVLATDIAQPLLQQVQERAADNSLTNIKTQLVNAVDLSFAEDCSFDAISFSLGLQFVPDKARCLAECFRVLRPGGVLVVSTMASIDKTDPLRLVKQIHSRLTPSQPWLDINCLGGEGALSSLVPQAGFQDLHQHELNNPASIPSPMAKVFVQSVLGPSLAAEAAQQGPQAKAAGAAATLQQQAEDMMMELLLANDMLTADGMAHIKTNETIVVDAVKPAVPTANGRKVLYHETNLYCGRSW